MPAVARPSRAKRATPRIAVPPELIERMARAEHDRWMAERLMSGWRPTADDEARNNDLMAHDKIVGWDQLNEPTATTTSCKCARRWMSRA